MLSLLMLLFTHLLSHEVALFTFFAIVAPFYEILQDNVNSLEANSDII